MRRAILIVGGLACVAGPAYAADPVDFAPGDPATIGGRPSHATRADLGADAYPDLVTWGPHTEYVGLLHGNGDGTLSSATLLTTPEPVLALGVADLNGDGVDDIVTGHRGQWTHDPTLPTGVFATAGAVHVLLSDVQGGFDGTEVTIHGRVPSAILFLDLDGDRDLDVIVASSDGTSTLTNDGDGGLSSPRMIATNWLTQTRDIADLDRDGNPDLVGHITLWGEDDGSFTPGTALNDITPLLAVDVDGDGDADLVGHGAFDPTAFGVPADLDVALNRGDGTFTAATGYASVQGPLFGVKAADVNGDGLNDLITSSQWGDVGVLLSEGDGTFDEALLFPHPNDGIPWGYEILNVDADGLPDLVTVDVGNGVVSANVVVHLQSAAPLTVAALAPAEALAGTEIDVVVTGSGFAPGTTVDLGQGVEVLGTTVVSASELRVAIRVDAFDAVTNPGGPRDAVVRHPDGRETEATFVVVPGPSPAVLSVTPSTLVAGTTTDLVIAGSDFAATVELELPQGVFLNTLVRVSQDVVQANVTVAAWAEPGAVAFRLVNRPTGTFVQSDASEVLELLGPRTLDLSVRRGDIKDKRKARRDSLKVSGDIAFNSYSPDGALGVPDETLTVVVGDPADPVTVTVPAGDPRWKVKKNGRAVWRSPKGAGPKVRIELDPVRGRFSVSVKKTDVTLPESSQVVVDLVVGNDTGRDLRRWVQPRVGRLMLR